MHRRFLILLMVFLILTGCTGAPPVTAGSVRSFTDDCGRTLEIPQTVTRIAVTGPLTQMYVLPLCGDLLVGHAGLTERNLQYLPQSLAELPELGQLYGGKGTLDPEALLAVQPQLVIDVGEAKDSTAEDLDRLTAQTGIPFLHLDATVETAADTYRRLGELLNRTEQAEQLARWCEATWSEIQNIMEQVDRDHARKPILYCLGEDGLHVLADGSYHAETLHLMADNVAILELPAASGLGNELDPEQLLLWDPEIILFAPDSIYLQAAEDPLWSRLQAIQNGQYYEAPAAPYGWLASPPSVQRYLGMLWLAQLLYPEYVTFDLQEKVTEYYALFYGCSLTDEAYNSLTRYALP